VSPGKVATLRTNQRTIFLHTEKIAMSRTLRVAVVGAGPAGLYALQHLLERRDLDVEIDLLERNW
jgi:cation diffusion facilitator CzcD-associated flavoprotein CzcO